MIQLRDQEAQSLTVPIGDDQLQITAPLEKALLARASLICDFARNEYFLGGAAGVTDKLPFGDVLTFTRGSTATYFGADGVMRTAAVDEPRLDHDPATGEALGLLIEESRTNIILNSAAPATQSVTTAASTYTISFYGTGTITLSGASSPDPLIGSGSNERVSLTFSASAGSLTITVSGDVQSAQLEEGVFPTSYIQTAGAAVTRAEDDASKVISAFYNAVEGAAFIHCDILGDTNLFEFYKDARNRWDAFYVIGNARIRSQAIAAAANAGNIDTQLLASQSDVRHAFSISDESGLACTNGGSVVEDASYEMPQGMTQLTFGNTVANTLQPAMRIKKFAYFPVKLSGTELQELTA